MANRRQFLGTLGKALGAGGLLLPWAGKGALALPSDLGPASKVPVTATPLPLSAEAVRARQVRRALRECHLAPSTQARHDEWRHLMVDHYQPLAQQIASRSDPTWSQCVELAEAIWHYLPKEGYVDGEPTGRLDAAVHYHGGGFATGAWWCRHQIVALVEAVLTLGGGERFDPKIGHGRQP